MKKILLALLLAVSFGFGAEYAIDKTHSYVGFKIKHLMFSTVRGTFPSYDGKVEFDPKAMKFLALSADVKIESIDTQNEKRDDHLKSADFFDVSKNPSILFAMTKFENGKVYGDLTMKGVKKPVVLDATINGVIKDAQGKERVSFELSGKIDRREFGLTYNKALESGGVVIGEMVDLVIEIQAIQK